RAMILARAGSFAATVAWMPSASRTFFTYSATRVSLPGGSVVSRRTSAWKWRMVSSLTLDQSGVWAARGRQKASRRTLRMRPVYQPGRGRIGPRMNTDEHGWPKLSRREWMAGIFAMATAQGQEAPVIPGKRPMILHNDRPEDLETPLKYYDSWLTPND